MTLEDRAAALYAEVNPVADVDALASQIGHRDRSEVTDHWGTSPIEPAGRRASPAEKAPAGHGRLLGTAVAVLMIVVVAASMIAGSDPVANELTEATSISEPPGAAAIALVEAAMEAINAGNIDAYRDLLSGGEYGEEASSSWTEIFINADLKFEIVEPCRLVSQTERFSTVSCTMTESNSFHGPAGLTKTYVRTFVIDNDDKIISVEDDEQSRDRDAQSVFNALFWEWMETAYPEVYVDIEPINAISVPGWRTDPADMSVAVEYVDEFISQSSNYPREAGSTP